VSALQRACYEKLMSQSLPSAEAEVLAKQLVADGWRQTSHRFRLIARLPPGETGKQALERASGHKWTLPEAHAAEQYRRCYADKEGYAKELDLRTFKFFRANGGGDWA
jgi:hypothetical protein